MGTKIRLSEDESELVQNAEILLTKNRVISKVMDLFGELARDMQKIGVFEGMPPKISRGEQYQGLPYMILDFPRNFSRDHIMAFRTMFWWGNYFIQTLHLRGRFLETPGAAIIEKLSVFRSAGFEVFVSGEEWHHDFEKGHFQSLEEFDATEIKKIIKQYGFLKISVRISLNDWQEAYEKFLGNYRLIMEAISSPGGETGL